MYLDSFGFWEKRHKVASEFFGVSEQTCKRWYDANNAPITQITVHHEVLIGGWVIQY